MISNSEKLTDALAKFRARNQTRKLEQILGSRQHGILLDMADGNSVNERAGLWKYFSDLSVKPFSTLSLSARDAAFKTWVSNCYSQTIFSNPILVSLSDLPEAEFAKVEILSVGDWVLDLRNYLTDEKMNFDMIIATSDGVEALEFWEEEYHFSAFRKASGS